MTKEKLKVFLEKSGAPLTYVSRETGVRREELSYFLHGHRDLSESKRRIVKEFFEEYVKRWRGF